MINHRDIRLRKKNGCEKEAGFFGSSLFFPLKKERVLLVMDREEIRMLPMRTLIKNNNKRNLLPGGCSIEIRKCRCCCCRRPDRGKRVIDTSPTHTERKKRENLITIVSINTYRGKPTLLKKKK